MKKLSRLKQYLLRRLDVVVQRGLREDDGKPGKHKSYDELAVARYSDIPDDRKGTCFVELFKKEGCSLGLTVSGGVDKGDIPRISNLRPGSIAHRSDQLEVGDLIISVNGIRTATLAHNEIINLLKNAGDRVVLEVEYELPDYAPQNSFTVQTKVVEVKLEMDDNSFGFTLRGGICSERIKCRPLTVTHIRPGGAADREGTLRAGDRILAVNGIDLTSSSLLEALDILYHCNLEAVFMVEYNVSIMDAVENACGPLLVEIDKTPGANLGIVLQLSNIRGRQVICISHIRQASIADRCGALNLGDQILSIDGTNLEHMTVAEATQLLKSSVGEQIKLEVIPQSQLRRSINALPPPKTTISSSNSCSSFGTMQKYGTLTSMGTTVPPNPMMGTMVGTMRSSVDTLGRYNSATARGSARSTVRKTQSLKWSREKDRKQSSLSLVSSLSVAPTGQVCHQDTLEVSLVANHKGFGFALEGGVFSTEMLSEPPAISYIERGGVAERSGVIQEGDRIISINGQLLEDKIMEEVNQLIRESGKRITLEIELDIADSVVPSCGIFNVKLAKKGGTLGITLSCPKNRKPSDCLLISDVKKGSVAHRCGSIHPGDSLLAVDNIRLETCSLDDAYQIIQNSGDIVTLRIRKDETYGDEPSPEMSVTYTVELQRYGGPLGITISGTEEAFDPIIISELSEGGLAERTGALHIGDRLLAINGHTLRGRSLSDAIHMLQNAGETVTLKVTRPTSACTRRRHNGNEQGRQQNLYRHSYTDRYDHNVPSVDSAVESWDGSGAENPHLKPVLHSSGIESSATTKSPISTHSGNSNNSSRRRQTKDSDADECDSDKELHISEDDWEHNNYPSYANKHRQRYNDRTFQDSTNFNQSDLLRQIDDTMMLKEIHRAPSSSGSIERNRDPSDLSSLQKNNSLISYDNSSVVPKNFRSADRGQGNHRTSQDNVAPTPVELHKLTLFREHGEDFGFCLSDGLYEKGVFVSAVRPGGPGDRAGLRIYDRILQVATTMTRDFDCNSTVPLIAAADTELFVVISRNPLSQSNDGGGASSSWQGLDNELDELSRSMKSSKTV
ncbi:glutamate receptor-interacting protein 1-like isoform X2 [Lingula anatina]|uniref:Glutamate receptor-interacting protein 1-like isoform X2 n=1 Tax=Lingula anatina TaxID=7574 RepID=A0A1S3IIB7_LINAN|nr:glutamate receptor-interacting protein 1-like isoform X2 [Lingula anatina]|eukprot:XP_013397244.1 glutamate receptor-interacting protein 1-like isoform X2 [Lingula anatina]